MSTDAEIRAVRIEEKRRYKLYKPPAPAPKHVVKPEEHGEVKHLVKNGEEVEEEEDDNTNTKSSR